MFADFYETSALKAANDAELDGLLKQSSSLSPASLKELSVKRATVTPFWWALWIMFRVSPSLSHLFCLMLKLQVSRLQYTL